MPSPAKRTRGADGTKVERPQAAPGAETRNDVGQQIGRVVRQLRDSQG